MYDPEPLQTRPIKRYNTARHYAHRIHESLTTRVSMFICAVFLGLLLLLGIIAFILWLSLRPHRPRFYIHGFSVPGLGQTNGFENAKITFNATARDSNQAIGISYGSMNGSVYYSDQLVGSTPLLSPFYQGPKNTTVVYGELSGATLSVNSYRWMQFQDDRADGKVGFRLEITATIRFRLSTWDSKSHRMHANCDVEVGRDGQILASSVNRRCPVYFT